MKGKQYWYCALSVLLMVTSTIIETPEARMTGVMAGGSVPAAANPCETGSPTEIVNISGAGTDSRGFNDWTIGQTFVGTAEPFYSISIWKETTGGGGTLTCRIGTSSNLSSTYTASVSITTTSAGQAWFEGVSSTCPTLSTGTWYVACSTATDLGVSIGIDDANPYAGGTYFFGTAHGFNLDGGAIAERDSKIIVKTRR